MDSYTIYKNNTEIPAANQSWLLKGTGMDLFELAEEPMPQPGPREILARVDAVSICFSDIKLIRAGSRHPRVLVPLEERPTVPGHEVSLTVLQPGAELTDSFSVGSRYIMQADIFKDGRIDTFGYTQRGGMALFVVIKETAIDGDHGCYMLPVQEETGYSEAALVEPWACVVSAYHIPRAHGWNEDDTVFIAPALRDMLEMPVVSRACRVLTNAFGELRPDRAIIPSDISAEEYHLIEEQMADGGVIAFAAAGDSAMVPVDAGAIHYCNLRIVSAIPDELMEAVETIDRQDVQGGGRTLMAGAGGPMGQMHLQRVFEMDNPPKQIVATDISDERLAFMAAAFEPYAKARDIDFKLFSAKLPPEELRKQLLECSEGGFDDIIILAPVAALVTESQYLARKGCLINIFAGLPVGSPFDYNPQKAADDGIRFTGSSGSSMDDIRLALKLIEGGQIQSDGIVRAIGGLPELKKGVAAVSESAYPGKVIIYPHLQNLPLTALEDLEAIYPQAASALQDGRWNRKAEQFLFNTLL